MSTPRRQFLRHAGVGAATAWVAPVILSQAAAAGTSVGPDPDPDPPDLPRAPTLLGELPAAAGQTTEWGRRIQDLALFDGIVFCGYGDWTVNTGPIQATGWRISPAGFVSEATLDTESTWLLRRVGSRLVIPFIDPKANTGDLAVRSAGSPTWTTLALDGSTAGSVHTFDVTTSNGTDLWVAGARRSSLNASVWHSPSGLGGDWVLSLDTAPPSGIDKWYARYTSIVSYGGSLYVAGYQVDPVPEPDVGYGIVARRFDGTTWVDAPEYSFDAGAALHRHGHEPQAFDGRVLRRRKTPGVFADEPLLSFDGSSLSDTGIAVRQWHVDAFGRLWWVSSDLLVRRMAPGGAPVVVATAPVGASAIVAEGTEIYLGTASSELWHVSLA
jgi:hypothetical protein